MPDSLTQRQRDILGTAFTSRERDLLDLWDRSNTPDKAGDELEHRLLAAYCSAAPCSLDELEADERRMLRAMSEECAADMEVASAEFGAMTEQHAHYLRRAAVRLSGDPETAKDLVQETLSRALRCFDQFEHGTNARAWLVRILTRLYLDMLKHRRVISRAEDALATLASIECEPQWPSIADAQLWAAVSELEPELRCVVERCYVHNMSYKAIADELKLPVGTIGTRLMRARRRLRALLTAPDRTRA